MKGLKSNAKITQQGEYKPLHIEEIMTKEEICLD